MEIFLILFAIFSGSVLLLWSKPGKSGGRLIAMSTDQRWKKAVWLVAVFGWVVAGIAFNYRFFGNLLTKH